MSPSSHCQPIALSCAQEGFSTRSYSHWSFIPWRSSLSGGLRRPFQSPHPYDLSSGAQDGRGHDLKLYHRPHLLRERQCGEPSATRLLCSQKSPNFGIQGFHCFHWVSRPWRANTPSCSSAFRICSVFSMNQSECINAGWSSATPPSLQFRHTDTASEQVGHEA